MIDSNGTPLRAPFIALRLYAGKCLGRGLGVDETIAELDELRDSRAGMRIVEAGGDFDVLAREAVRQACEWFGQRRFG